LKSNSFAFSAHPFNNISLEAYMILLYTFTLTCILTAVENFIIGPVVYRLNKSDTTARWLSLCISVGIWSLGLGLEVISKDAAVALFWSKFHYCGVVFIPITYFHFVASLVNVAKEKIKSIRIGYIIAIALLIINLFGGIVSTVSPKQIFRHYTDAGTFYPLMGVYFAVYIAYAFYLQIKTFLKVHGYERAKIAYNLTASTIGFVGGFCAFSIPFNFYPYAFLGVYIVWIYPLVIAYSIVTVKLMDIEIFIHRTTRALVGIVAFFFLLYVSYFTLQNFFQEYFGRAWFILPTLIFGIALVSLIFFIKHVFRMSEENLSEKFAYRPILKELAKRTAKASNMEELLAFTARFTSAYAKIDYMGILILRQDKHDYELVRSLTRTSKREKISCGTKIERDNPIISYLEHHHAILNLSRVNFELKKRDLSFQKKRELLVLKREIEKWPIELCVPCYSDNLLLGMLFMGQRTDKEMFLPKDEDLFLTVADQIAKPIHNFFYKKEAIEGFIRSQDVVVRAVEAKDPYTKGHSERVAEISYVLGEKIGLNESELEFLKYAARLHDIGKIAMRDSVLNKEERLTAKEYEETKTHPLESIKMIYPIVNQLGISAVEAILHHHENLDGTGYPDGQKNEEIHVFAKIIRVADTIDALSTNRPYRKTRTSIKWITEELSKYSGEWFDPKVTEKAIHLCEDETFMRWFKKMIKETGAVSRI